MACLAFLILEGQTVQLFLGSRYGRIEVAQLPVGRVEFRERFGKT